MPIRSMTGFARVSRSTPFGELTLSIKTVNHRGLDLHFHMPLEFDARRTRAARRLSASASPAATSRCRCSSNAPAGQAAGECHQ